MSLEWHPCLYIQGEKYVMLMMMMMMMMMMMISLILLHHYRFVDVYNFVHTLKDVLLSQKTR